MAVETKVAIADSFLDSLLELPKPAQSKVKSFVQRFRNNPSAPGINYEKLKANKDKRLWSVRIDDAYRGILIREQTTSTYILVWVDKHDAAYTWAKNHSCRINPNTGALQIFEAAHVSAPAQSAPAVHIPRLFDAFSDAQLMQIGLPDSMLPLVRTLSAAHEFAAKKRSFPSDVYDLLTFLVEGEPFESVMALVEDSKESGTPVTTIAEALETPASSSSVYVVKGEDELLRILDAPMEKWRVFLHPTQRRIVDQTYSGPARVLGGAGTGKTVVAMHRARALAAKLKDNERVLFTTYTTNLAEDIRDNLRKICTIDELRRIEVVNLDQWTAQYLRESGYEAKIAYDERLDPLWDDAIVVSDVSDLPRSFFVEEYAQVVRAQNISTLEEYLKARRTGRGVRLDRKKRKAVWEVFEAYNDILKDKDMRDISSAMRDCIALLSKAGSSRYRHVIVDESQDLGPDAFRLLRAIAGEEHPDDIFIVGDSRQRIYKNRAALSACGINVRGRSRILRVNYRTTEEIRRAAIALLDGIAFDDLDSAELKEDECHSLTHGSAPVVRRFANADAELDALANEISRIVSEGSDPKDICVAARTRYILDDYAAGLTAKGIHCFVLGQGTQDDRGHQGVRLATMHRIKGLEFKYVFLVSANKGKIPYRNAIDSSNAVSMNETTTAEKCLVYVALTRAQMGVFVSGYGEMSEFFAGAKST